MLRFKTSLSPGCTPEQERPLGGYAVLVGTFLGAAAGFGTWLARTVRGLPEKVDLGDLLLDTIARISTRLVTAIAS